MQVCPGCGEENPPRFRLCGFCGTPLAQPLAQVEVRKTVTIVFSDLQGSTSLGEKLDSESFREVLSRYFEVMRGVLEEHGGLIEKYIGDAIMAVFGLPRVHEDDALRAVSAAAGMKHALHLLNDELEARWGVRLVNRTGVNTGEVVAGDPTTGQRLVSGDVVNVAARLEQAAPPLETLIGESTHRLVRHAAEVEAVEPLELKGKSERVPAYRLIGVQRQAQALGRSATPMVGRDAELRLLMGALHEAQVYQAARLVTVLGDPGVGKTRLIYELSERAASSARVLRGRCLSYGSGITFWPLVEIVRQASDIQSTDQPEIAWQKLHALLPDAPDATARVASAMGLGETTFPLQEIYWGTRKLFEALAAESGLVVVIEDTHWAEPAFLDLVEYVVEHLTGALLLVCSGRPELVEQRPAWSERPGWLRVDLLPLTDRDSETLIAHLLGDSKIPPQIHKRIVAAAEGNPLFVEQLLGMLVDDGMIRRETDGWRVTKDLSQLEVPGSIQALLAARLELLTQEEQALLEPASVIGQVFREDALEELVPDALRGQLSNHLGALVRRRLLQPDANDSNGRWYRFQHILIRDTAYRRLLKRTRATLHERVANWGERVNGEREGAVEYEEIHGYHLEQAHGYLAELGPLDDHGRELGTRAAAHLGAAGMRAFERGDTSAACNLLQRAVALLSERDRARVALLPSLAEALMESGEFGRATGILDEAVRTATELDDTRLLADAVFSQLRVRRRTADDIDGWQAEVGRATLRFIPLLERLEAHAELATAWRLVAFVHGTSCQWEQAAAAQQRAIEHARRSGRRRLEARLSGALAQALRDGPTPVPDATRACEKILAAGLIEQQAEALVTLHLGYLHALAGEIAVARRLCQQARLRLLDIGGTALTAASIASIGIGRVELLADNAVASVAELRSQYDVLGSMGERYFRPLIGALLAQAEYSAGHVEEALTLTTDVHASVAADDVEAHALWRCVRGKALARAGDFGAALRLAQDAVDVLKSTDAPVMVADTLVDQATVLLQAGRADDAADALRRARELYLLKRAKLPLHRLDALLAGVGLVAPSLQQTDGAYFSANGAGVSRRSRDLRPSAESAEKRPRRPSRTVTAR